MKGALLVALLAASACRGAPTPTRIVPEREARVMRDVEHLASPALEGRAAGSRGAMAAAIFIGERFAALGLEPVFPAPCGEEPECEAAMLQRFHVPPGRTPGGQGRNVAALLRGADPALRHEYVVVGAHYDHLGRAPIRRRELTEPIAPRAQAIHYGADDNASGTAALLELARRLAERPPRRSVLFVAFGAEELGLVGSGVFVREPPVALDSVTAMLNLDMVGRLGGQALMVYGTHEPDLLRMLVDSAGALAGVPLRLLGPGEGRSDHASFRRRGIPALHFHTGEHPDYHMPSDVARRIDGEGLVRVIDVVEAAARLIADDPERMPRE